MRLINQLGQHPVEPVGVQHLIETVGSMLACRLDAEGNVPISPLPDLLPGEDRSFGSSLFVDLIPRG